MGSCLFSYSIYIPITTGIRTAAVPVLERNPLITPTITMIAMSDPQLTHKGTWLAWFGGLFLCVLNVLSILFADELFHLHMAFRIRNADRAEPSELEIAGRYFSWTAMTVVALVVFVIGLQ